jgi:hypothetical protein
MPLELNSQIKIARVMNSVAAGTTNQTSSTLDMAGYEGVLFIALFGVLTATQVTSLKARQGAASDMSDGADLLGSKVGPLADTDGTKCLVLDVKRSNERYMDCVVNRATANAVIDGVIAIQYGPDAKPTAHAASVAFSEAHVSPIEGTA